MDQSNVSKAGFDWLMHVYGALRKYFEARTLFMGVSLPNGSVYPNLSIEQLGNLGNDPSTWPIEPSKDHHAKGLETPVYTVRCRLPGNTVIMCVMKEGTWKISFVVTKGDESCETYEIDSISVDTIANVMRRFFDEDAELEAIQYIADEEHAKWIDECEIITERLNHQNRMNAAVFRAYDEIQKLQFEGCEQASRLLVNGFEIQQIFEATAQVIVTAHDWGIHVTATNGSSTTKFIFNRSKINVDEFKSKMSSFVMTFLSSVVIGDDRHNALMRLVDDILRSCGMQQNEYTLV